MMEKSLSRIGLRGPVFDCMTNLIRKSKDNEKRRKRKKERVNKREWKKKDEWEKKWKWVKKLACEIRYTCTLLELIRSQISSSGTVRMKRRRREWEITKEREWKRVAKMSFTLLVLLLRSFLRHEHLFISLSPRLLLSDSVYALLSVINWDTFADCPPFLTM